MPIGIRGFVNTSYGPVSVVDMKSPINSRYFERRSRIGADDDGYCALLGRTPDLPLAVNTESGAWLFWAANRRVKFKHNGVETVARYDVSDNAKFYMNVGEDGQVWLSDSKLQGKPHLRLSYLKCEKLSDSISETAATAAVCIFIAIGGVAVSGTKVGSFAGGLAMNTALGVTGVYAEDLAKWLLSKINSGINAFIRDDVYLKINNMRIPSGKEDYYSMEQDQIIGRNEPLYEGPMFGNTTVEVLEYDRGGEYFHDLIGYYTFKPSDYAKISSVALVGDSGGIYTMDCNIIYK